MAKRRTLSLEEVATEVGRLFGTTERHARKWLAQRGAMLEALHLVRDRASDLIVELSGEKKRAFRKRAAVNAKKAQVPAGHPSEMLMGRKKRRTSAATRAKMRAAAQRRSAVKRKNT